MKGFVVDANVLIAALLADGTTRRVLFHASVPLYVPPGVWEEIERVMPELQRRAGLAMDLVREVLRALEGRVIVVPEPLYASRLAEATALTTKAAAEGDEHYVALALALGVPVWTYDKDFGRIPAVRTVKTSQVPVF